MKQTLQVLLFLTITLTIGCSSTRIVNIKNDDPEMVKYKRTYLMRYSTSETAKGIFKPEQMQGVVISLKWLDSWTYSRCFLTADIDKRNIFINKK